MTDEKFEQLLHQALTPSVNDADILVNPPDRRKKMKKITKIAVCAAACMAFVVAAAKITQTKDALTTIVYANENGDNIPLEEGKAVVVNSESEGHTMGGQENGLYYYNFDLPLVCEGENIKSITYSVNDGCFQVIEQSGKHVVEGTKCQSIDPGLSVPADWSDYSISYYTELTVSDEAQKSGEYVMHLVKDDYAMPDPDLVWGENATTASTAQVIQEMLKDTVITCTIQFEDGNSETVTLKASAQAPQEGQPDVVQLLFTMQ